MDVYFLDSSTLVKRFAAETGTRPVIELFKTKPYRSIYAARVTFVETSSALARKANSGNIKGNAEIRASRRLNRAFEQRIISVEIDEPVVLHAVQLARKYLLRGDDAIQLASAIRVANRRHSIGATLLIFVSADNDLNKAALAEGLTVENPNDNS